jgi:L-gulonolactone oxidase
MQVIRDGRDVSNWKGDITYRPAVIAFPETLDDIQKLVRDPVAFPTPVRVKGSHHSVTDCVVADGGTVLDMSRLTSIVRVDQARMTVTMQAGVQLKDASSQLERLGLQFYVNVELGNLTVGSGACCGTKKASFHDGKRHESGQVSAYVVSLTVVTADGSAIVVDEREPALLEAMRSSYGMLGVVYEVTYKIKKLRPMRFTHTLYSLSEFAVAFEGIRREPNSAMFYIFPFIDRVVVERRWPSEGKISWFDVWKIRNFAWKQGAPFMGRVIGALPVGDAARAACLNAWFRVLSSGLTWLSGTRSSPENQIMRYPARGGFTAYTFSLWAFDDDKYVDALRAYLQFCKDYHRTTGYRCDMPSVGYRLAEENGILFSYSRNGFAATIDPVSTGGSGWATFLDAFNERSSEKNGRPLFNQTPRVTHEQAKHAFGEQIAAFVALRERLDPADRFYTAWFRYLFTGSRVAATPRPPSQITAAQTVRCPLSQTPDRTQPES